MPGSPPLPKNLTVEDLLLLSELRNLMASGEARHTREQANVSQREMAAASGVTNVSISLWESGKRQPSGVGALRYARLLRAIAKHLAAREEVVARDRPPATVA